MIRKIYVISTGGVRLCGPHLSRKKCKIAIRDEMVR